MSESHEACTSFLKGLHILVVDDVAVFQDMIADILCLAGARTFRAKDGRHALAILADKELPTIDVVIMDLEMPVMDGIEATRRLRRRMGLTELPVIACTSKPLPEIWRVLVEAGFSDYHPKPIHADELMETLERWAKPVPSWTQVDSTH